MSNRTRALLLRLAAIEITGEYGAPGIRRTLRDLGMDDAAIDAAVRRARASVEDDDAL